MKHERKYVQACYIGFRIRKPSLNIFQNPLGKLYESISFNL